MAQFPALAIGRPKLRICVAKGAALITAAAAREAGLAKQHTLASANGLESSLKAAFSRRAARHQGEHRRLLLQLCTGTSPFVVWKLLSRVRDVPAPEADLSDLAAQNLSRTFTRAFARVLKSGQRASALKSTHPDPRGSSTALRGAHRWPERNQSPCNSAMRHTSPQNFAPFMLSLMIPLSCVDVYTTYLYIYTIIAVISSYVAL